MFLAAKQCLRAHPGWDDDQVAEFIGAKPAEMELVREARKDAGADVSAPGRIVTPHVQT